MFNLINILEIVTSFSLLGLIWVIQLVHYPSFRYIAEDKFRDFILFHGKSISFIVMPLMIIELTVAIGLSFSTPSILTFSKFGIVCLIWLSTFTLSVPKHSKLLRGRDNKIIEGLIYTNWPRTILWTLKAVLVGYHLV